MHQIGFGSLMPRRKFVIYDKKGLRWYSPIGLSFTERLARDTRENRYSLKEEIDEFWFNQYVDNEIKLYNICK